jgi:nitric oxide reductase activation protein
MTDGPTLNAIRHAIDVLVHAQELLLMVFDDKPQDLERIERKALLGKHVREIEDTLRELRRVSTGPAGNSKD